MVVLDARDFDRLTLRLTNDFAEMFGSRPRRPTTDLDADVLDFSFLNGLDREEDSMRHRGRRQELRAHREEALEPVGLALAGSVADVIGSPVQFHVELFDPLAARTTFLFGLDSRLRNLAVLDDPDLFERSRSLRAETHRLREESASARETAARMRARVRRDREGRG
jgi:hypothetical protein